MVMALRKGYPAAYGRDEVELGYIRTHTYLSIYLNGRLVQSRRAVPAPTAYLVGTTTGSPLLRY